ncbi:hypothetical protein DFJ74DRAFT_681757 [Hyaloraphidium curvatum]|nr:hypothetical protein DFJ74DRAFT_681757 [Hyaloraphidium curvatum]
MAHADAPGSPWEDTLEDWRAEQERLERCLADFAELERRSMPSAPEPVAERRPNKPKSADSGRTLRETRKDGEEGRTTARSPGKSAKEHGGGTAAFPTRHIAPDKENKAEQGSPKRSMGPKDYLRTLFPKLAADCSFLTDEGGGDDSAPNGGETSAAVMSGREVEGLVVPKQRVTSPSRGKDLPTRTKVRACGPGPRASGKQPVQLHPRHAVETPTHRSSKLGRSPGGTTEVTQPLAKPPNVILATSREVSALQRQMRELQRELRDAKLSSIGPQAAGHATIRKEPVAERLTFGATSLSPETALPGHSVAARSLGPPTSKRAPKTASHGRDALTSTFQPLPSPPVLDCRAQRARLDEMQSIVEAGTFVQESMLADGTLLRSYGGNISMECLGDGVVVIRLPNGESTYSHPNGDVITMFPSGDQVLYVAASGCIETTYNDGAREVEFPDGHVECIS